MIRTQISLDSSEISWLKSEAKARGTSMAGMVRRIIHYVARKKSKAAYRKALNGGGMSVAKKRHPWVGLCKDGPPTDARLVDDYLYSEGESV